jgi:hypothetical protein
MIINPNHNPINIETILESPHPSKYIFSTSVFVNNFTKLHSKTLNYFSGLVKLIEIFKFKTNWKFDDENKWNLNIYINKELYDLSLQEIDNLSIDLDKKKLIKLFHDYFHHINNHHDEYLFINLYKFEFIGFTKSTCFTKSPELIGTNVRFLSLFDAKYERVMLINCCHSITDKLMILINEWIKSKNIILTNYRYYWNVKNCDSKFHSPFKLKYGMYNLRRIPAGCSGYYFPSSNKKRYDFKLFTSILNFMIHNYNNDINLIKYGNDEIILGYLTKNKLKNIYFYNQFKTLPDNHFTEYTIINKNKTCLTIIPYVEKQKKINIEVLLDETEFENKEDEKITGKFIRFWIKNGFYQKFICPKILFKNKLFLHKLSSAYTKTNFYDFNNLLTSIDTMNPILLISQKDIIKTKQDIETSIYHFKDYFEFINISDYNLDNIFLELYPILKQKYITSLQELTLNIS